MKKGFNFEKNLSHQSQAVDSTIEVFQNIPLIQPTEVDKNFINSCFDFKSTTAYPLNIKTIQSINGIKEEIERNSNIIDIMMETGTGKTYTYTKTIFELNKQYGIFKFIVVVPTLSIKAGTIDFLKSDSSREHFKEQYGKTLHLHIVESQKKSKNKRSYIPPSVTSFVNAGKFEKNSIQVMIINAGMINSKTMQGSFDKGLFDKYTVPFDAIGATNPIMIIDEPHKFGIKSKTWENIKRMKPQFILRYGATFKAYENLVYTLTAVDSFNRNLVKGVIGHITEFEIGKNAIVRFVSSDEIEATFEITEDNNKKSVKIAQKESLNKLHPKMTDLRIEKLNKTTVGLSNGLELKKGDKINPYSYDERLQEIMIKKAVKQHFEIEKLLLTREVKIKPITLFFIDNIEEYRSERGYLLQTVEACIEAEVKKLLKSEMNPFYILYLKKTLIDISKAHGGYFAIDKKGKDSDKEDDIAEQLNEILHNKQAMLDLNNPRRFIFSKWTLREGWDNPNVFQICKLRSSGSEISKIQEVGRGLRLPVNEYGNRVKDEQFYLNYFVDFTESDFVDELVKEINKKSGAFFIEENPPELSQNIINQIIEKYDIEDENILLQKLIIDEKVIDFSKKFLENGFTFIKDNYPLIFQGINSNKIRKATEEKKKVVVRTEKYKELKELWEKLNEKVILEYKFENERDFKELLIKFLNSQSNMNTDGVYERTSRVEFEDGIAFSREESESYNKNDSTFSTMKYSEFLKQLSKVLNINIKTIHQSIIESNIEINKFLSQKTIRVIRQNFDHFLMANAIDNFNIEYKNVTNNIHPTKLTDKRGNLLKEVTASDVGIMNSEGAVAENYLFNELYYDSQLEKINIETNIKEIIVFTKIPKNSIKIPVAGGKSYSPDFAYVSKFDDNSQILNFIVETKDVNNANALRDEERFKIKHAEKFFNGDINIQFKTQFSNDKIVDLINQITEGN